MNVDSEVRTPMANVVEAMTERLLADGGISSGMRVLDVGCGGGAVSRMAARLVGKTGQVLGSIAASLPSGAQRKRQREKV